MQIIILIVVGTLAVSFLAALALSRHSILASICASILSVGFAAFCAFGYLASFELAGSESWPWQLVYGILGVGALMTAFLGVKRSLKHNSSKLSKNPKLKLIDFQD